jgi:hypothetical protein
VLFTNAAPGQPDAAFTEENDGTEAEIAALVRQGYLVRTRTDADERGPLRIDGATRPRDRERRANPEHGLSKGGAGEVDGLLGQLCG